MGDRARSSRAHIGRPATTGATSDEVYLISDILTASNSAKAFGRICLVAAIGSAACTPPVGYHDHVAAARAELTPAGRLRAAINYGNPILASRNAFGEPRGIVVELVQVLASQLDVPFTLVEYESAAEVADAATSGKWDVAFIAADPAREAVMTFSPPYVVLESTYLVPANSRLNSAAEVDAEGVRVAARPRSAYDLALRRTLMRARLVYPAEGETDVGLVRDGKADALAGLRQVLEDTTNDLPGSRVLPGNFTEIRQAIAVPHGRREAAAYLRSFVESAKQSGTVARTIEVSGARGASVAP